MKIIVLFGGTSSEREVSLVSGTAIGGVLMQLGHQVVFVDPLQGYVELVDDVKPVVHESPPSPEELSGKSTKSRQQRFQDIVTILNREQPDFVFNALHGGEGEDGHWQAVLDMLGIPYNGSDVASSVIAMQKSLAKKLFESEGILTPRYVLLSPNITADEAEAAIRQHLTYPLVVKPDREGSTVGLSIVQQRADLQNAISAARPYGALLVEEFIEGREITVAILGERALPVIEIIPEGGFYDYEHKYQKEKTHYVCPANLSKSATEKVQRFALKAFHSLGCRGYARVDFRLGLDDRFYCLEVNTLPGMTETSLVPKAAKAAGIEFQQLVDMIIRLSLLSK